MGKISNYTRVLKAKLADLLVCDTTDSNVTTTKSVTVEQIGDAICGEQVHADLDTNDETIIGGINEVNGKVGSLSTLTTSDKSSLVGAVNEVNRKTKSIYSNSTYSNQLGTAITTTDNMGDFRFLRITIGVSSFDSLNMTYILIPNCKGSTTGYYQFASNNVGGKIIRLSTDTTTTLTLISSSEASICVSQVVGIY